MSNALTLATLRTRVRRYTGDVSSDTTKQRWSNSIIDDAINDSLDEFAAQTLLKIDTATDTSVAGDVEYTFPTDAYKLTRIEMNGKTIYPTSMSELDMWKRNWRDDTTGEPKWWYHTSARSWKFYPPCDSGNESQTITYYYYDIPMALTTTTDSPDFAGEYHKAIAHGAAAELLTNDREYDLAGVHQAKFEAFKQRAASALRRMHDRAGPMRMTIERDTSPADTTIDPLQRFFWG